MKKILLILISTFFFFFFIPNALALENQKIDCISTDDRECTVMRFFGYVFNRDTLKYKMEKSFWGSGRMALNEFQNVYYDDISGGPPTIYSNYITSITNDESENFYLKYNLKPNIVYSFVYTFYSEGSLIGDTKVDDLFFKFKGNYKDKEYSYDDNIAFLQRIGFSESTDTSTFDEWVLDHNAFYNDFLDTKTTVTFKFWLKKEVDSFQFTIGKDNLNINDVHNGLFILRYNNYQSKGNRYKIYYNDFNIYSTDDTVHGGGGLDLDNPNSDDTSIFDNLKKCDAMDIGCHFDNLLTMLKNLFVRIGNFFRHVWDGFLNIIDFITNFFKMLYDFFVDLLKFLFVPSMEDINSIFDTLNTFLTNKLGFLMFPFDFIIDFLGRFTSLSESSQEFISVGSVDIGGFGTLIHGFTYNIAEYWNKPPFKQFYDIYLLFVHAFIGFGLYKLSLKKFNEILGGSSK